MIPPVPDRQERHNRRASGHVQELGPPIPVASNPRARPTYANMSLADIHRLHAEEDALLPDAMADLRALRGLNQRTRMLLAAITDTDNEDLPDATPPVTEHYTRNHRERLPSITENRIQGLGPALLRGMELSDQSLNTRSTHPPPVLGNRANVSRGAVRPNVLATRQARGRDRGSRDVPLVLSDSD